MYIQEYLEKYLETHSVNQLKDDVKIAIFLYKLREELKKMIETNGKEDSV